MQNQQYDIIIIGAGCIGAFTCLYAQKLQSIKVLILEKENDASQGTTKANSGIVHSSHNTTPNTFKIQFVDRGNELIKYYSQKMNYGYTQCGEIVVAKKGQEQQILDMYNFAVQQKLHCQMLNKQELKELEPNINDEIEQGILVKDPGVVNSYEMTMATIYNCEKLGATIKYNNKVTDIKYDNNLYTITTNQSQYQAKVVINAAGLFSDEIAKMIDPNTKIHIRPRKGEEYLLDKNNQGLVKHVIFPLPENHSKGTLIIPTVDGTIMVGPNAQFVDNKDDKSTSQQGLNEVFQKGKQLVPSINQRQIIASFAGNRAVDDSEDFVINSGLQSPGLTCSPAIGEYVLNKYLKQIFNNTIIENKIYPLSLKFNQMTPEQKLIAIQNNKKYSDMVCYCEQVTVADIENAIDEGAKTIDGVKLRTRAGMGRCQSGMCLCKTSQILASKLNIQQSQVLKMELNSQLGINESNNTNIQQNNTNNNIINNKYDIVIIGAGAAGLAAGIEAKQQNDKLNILIIDRSNRAGGILNQCIHSGFGLSRYHQELTGPEFAEKLNNEAKQAGVNILLNTYVNKIDKQNKQLSVIIKDSTTSSIKYNKLIITTGSKERTAKQINLSGDRLAGVYTAGQAQNLLNNYNILVGKKVVILGSGDIGLIMARRMTLSGAKVLGIYELLDRINGLQRNLKQCATDFNIPVHLSRTVTGAYGKGRLEYITISDVDKQLKIIPNTEEKIFCDCLLLSVGLIPEQQLINKQIQTDSYKQFEQDYFIAGNSLQIHDLADDAANEGKIAAHQAAQIQTNNYASIQINKSQHFGYIIPNKLYVQNDNQDIQQQIISFRVKQPYGNSIVKLIANQNNQQIIIQELNISNAIPANMCHIKVNQAKLNLLYHQNPNIQLYITLEQIKQQIENKQNKKQVQCIICPNSCTITIDMEDVTGNKCNRGKIFALQEIKEPKRNFSTTVQLVNYNINRLPVKTLDMVPINKMVNLSLKAQQIQIASKDIAMGDVVATIEGIRFASCCSARIQ